VRAENVKWVITDPGRLRGDRKAANRFSAIDRVVTTPGGAQLVASSGSTKLWRLTACW
jgi:hypothetical protein